MLDVFVSRPTWVAPAFKAGLDIFLSLLQSADLRPRTVGATDYPTKSPLDEVIQLMRECKGAIVLGYPQITVDRGTCREADCSGLSLATEWNHIEAALAYSQQLPLLVIHHQGIKRGVFDRGAVSTFLHEVDLRDPTWSMQPSTNGALLKWKRDCLAGPVQVMNVTPGMGDKPVCPNCSTVNRPYYLRPVGAPFRDIAGGDWECSKCHYVE